MNYVFVTSPAGSGTNFAITLLQRTYNMEASSRGHERKNIEDGVHQISVLRNPYDCIASGAERWLVGAKHQDFLNSEDLTTIDNIPEVKKRIGWEEQRYREFFYDIESLENVKVVSFELLTENSNKFVEVAQKFFNIQKEHIDILDEEVLKHASTEGRENRIPRKESEDRSIINELVQEMYPKETWKCWKIYSDLKAKLDKEGL